MRFPLTVTFAQEIGRIHRRRNAPENSATALKKQRRAARGRQPASRPAWGAAEGNNRFGLVSSCEIVVAWGGAECNHAPDCRDRPTRREWRS
jgi:hypothetical protein